MMSRNEYYKKLGMAKNALIQQGKLTEGDYRGLLAMHGAIEDRGRFSATTLPTTGLAAVLSRLKALGWKDQRSMRVVNTPVQKKIWALWFELKALDAIENDSKQALDAWIRREAGAGVGGIQALSAKPHREKAMKVIEQLKKWVERETDAPHLKSKAD